MSRKEGRGRRAKAYRQVSVPINRMSEVDEGKKKALPKFAADAWQKEFDLRNAIGPSSTTDERPYPQEIKVKK